MNSAGRYAVPAAVLLLALYFLFLVREVLLPFILAGTLAYLLNPVVVFFVVRGMRRSTVVVLIYAGLLIGLLGSLYGAGSLLSQEAAEAALKMPEYVQKGQKLFDDLCALGEAGPSAAALAKHPLLREAARHTDLLGAALSKAKDWPARIVQSMPSLASHLLPLLELAFLIPFLTFFFMMEGSKAVDALFQLVPARYVEVSLNMLVEVDNSLGNYVRALSLEALAVGLTAFLGFWAIDLDYALQIAALVGLANLIPYVGPIVGLLLGGAVAAFQWGTLAGVLKVLFVCGAVRFIEDWFLQPVIMKRGIHLHPALLVFSLMAGTKLWGFWGLLFGVPVACMAKVLLQILWNWQASEYGRRDETVPNAVSHLPLI